MSRPIRPLVGKERRLNFEALVLAALWQIVHLLHRDAVIVHPNSRQLRENMLEYLNEHGDQDEEAWEHRRENVFHEI